MSIKKILVASLLPFFSYGLTLEEAVKIGIKNNRELKSYKEDIEIAKYQLKEDKQLYMPYISGSYRYTFLKDTPYMSLPAGSFLPVPLSFKQNEKNYYSFSVAIGYPLYTGGVREAKIKISSLDIKGKNYLYKEKENKIKSDIKKAYYDVLMAKKLVQIYKKELEAVKAHLRTVKGFYEEGLVAKVDLLQAQVRISEVKRDLRKAEGNLRVAKSRLAVLLGKDIDYQFSVEEKKEKIKKDFDLFFLIEKAYQNRGIIKEIEIKKKQLKKYTDIYKGNFLPKISTNIFYTKTNQFPYLTPKENTGIEISVSLNFQGIKPYYGILKTKKMKKKIEYILEDIKKKISLDVKSAYENLKTTLYNLDVSEKALKQAEEYYRMVVEQYKNQLASGTDVLDAEAALTRARKGREISYYQYLKAYADLERAVGGGL